jgi:short-subunit dehydrogenase
VSEAAGPSSGPPPCALVTGASGGIGAAFARLLAGDGHDLVLVARRREQLDALAAELVGQHGVEVEVLVADLTDGDDVRAVEARLADLHRPIDLLVNNAGAGVTGDFIDSPIAEHRRQIDLNITAVVCLSHAAARVMEPRKQGAILNVSSLGGLAPAPRFATYAASKAFVVSFSEALHEELRPSGVKVTCVCPGATRTDFGKHSGADADDLPELLWQTADEVAAQGLAALARNQAVCVTGGVNRATAALTHLLPRGAVRRVSGLVASRL